MRLRADLHRIVLAASTAVLSSIFSASLHAADFAAAVTATHPIAYYRLNAPEGKSVVGNTTYKSTGGVSLAGPGAPVGAGSQFIKFNGQDAHIVSTQSGGVKGAASMMAWVNLAALPSTAGHFFYVMGESQYGNDLDLQFENDNKLKFYTAAGGNVNYTPAPDTLINQWHFIVVTLDTPTRTRVIYWDGKPVASDQGSGQPNKSGAFTIGASTVFRGRFFSGGMQEVALWDRALSANEVATIYAASSPAAAAVATPAPAGAPAGAPAAISTSATIEVEDSGGPVKLKPEEKIAIMFLTAIQNMQTDCQLRVNRACTMEQLLVGPVAGNGARLGHLKFDPATDANYSYTLSANGTAWELHANAKKPGLLSFYALSKGIGGPEVTYNPAGTAGPVDKQLTSRSVMGDSFVAR